jgi:plastocyanin domain-containing protein
MTNKKNETDMKAIAAVALFVILAAGCGTSSDSSEKGTGVVTLIDGHQVVQISAHVEGFEPARVELKAGTPVELVFKRTSESSCAETISIPEFGIEKTPLPVGEEVAVTFTPEEAGEFTFVCGMDMAEGALVVTS